MNIQDVLTKKVKEAFETLYNATLNTVEFQATRKDFEGDITVVVFPMLRVKKMNPAQLGQELGQYLVENVAAVNRFNVVKGFLNLVIDDSYYLNFFAEANKNDAFGHETSKAGDKAVMVEYSSPNTNKPLHLGHIRNNLLGYSVAEIIKASGKKVYKTQIINDRGIHICKSMLAWQRFGNGETPQSTGLKGDKLVGNYYVAFDKAYKAEIAQLIAEGKTEDDAKKEAPILLEAQEMLRKWEAGDEEIVALWKQMNQWVYDGFAETYTNLGVDFDALYYESDTYLLGKDFVKEGLVSGVFYMKDDGSVWCDLTEEGLDEKIVLRSDGTAVYMTQDIGTAIQRVKDYPDIGGMIYTVGNEQDYHFKVLFLILKKLGFEWSKNLHHLSYGMVDLPSGKMKSREGTVVDADDLMQEMVDTAKQIANEKGKLDGYSEEEKNSIHNKIGLGALKYQMLKVDPKKRILFDPEDSIDFNGDSGPFIQMMYVRTRAILRKANFDYSEVITNIELHEKEKELLKVLENYPTVIQTAASNQSPALIANYAFDLSKEFSSYYQMVSILGETDKAKKVFRVQLSKKIGDTIKLAFGLLGIQVPERM
ncbi:arginine--tRNA ligase [Kordia algicida OT-1]|uniref:Arginine--tRNA ligase n=1 Tax=Kordia algicida OT-1 TaxID=391587 RepID=A9DIM0_9FLAO|nr:arginine--tRNA ligase [Kordia algicida]EDP97931.1 arginyl-tRNA synthetase [Kordia algicida OT-1]